MRMSRNTAKCGPCHEKNLSFEVRDQVILKPASSATEAIKSPGILDIATTGIVQSTQQRR